MLLATDFHWGFSIALPAVLWAFVRSLIFNRNSIPILEIGLLLAGVQWLIAPCIAYAIRYEHHKMTMYCSESAYLSVVGPSLVAYAFGLFFFEPRDQGRGPLSQDLLNWNPNRVTLYRCLATALIALILHGFAPPALAFPLLLISLTRLPIALVLLHDSKPSSKFAGGAVFAHLIVQSVSVGMFNSVTLWLLIAMPFSFSRLRLGLPQRTTVTALAAASVILLQVVKPAYRENRWAGAGLQESLQGASTEVRSITSGSRSNLASALEATLPRFNQGWLISAAISYTPSRSPYLDGESVIDSIEAALVPSALTDKRLKRGSGVLVERCAGITVAHGTSMTLSTVGESYVNFGPRGAPLMMFALGSLFSIALRFCRAQARKRPPVLAVIPVIFVGALAPGAEIYGQLNHIFKALVLLIPLAYLLPRTPIPPGRLGPQER